MKTALPQSGAEARSAALALTEKTKAVQLHIPAFKLAGGKVVHISLQSDRDGDWYGIPGKGWRAGRGEEVKADIPRADIPDGATAVRLLFFTELEAGPISATAELTAA